MSGARNGKSRGGSGAVSGLNLPLMAAKACCPLYSLYALCSLQFTSLPPYHPGDQSWSLCTVVCVYNRPYISNTAELSLQSTLF